MMSKTITSRYKSKLSFSPSLKIKDPSTALLIYDEALVAQHAKLIEKFPLRFGVRAGESLKDLRNFPELASALVALANGHSPLKVVALGGGSVGDFAGFFASVYRRGIPLVQIPSTWLAAIDSAHGGKTALNVGGFKNVLGTFYPAQEVWLVRDILASQSAARAVEAQFELIKMIWLQGGPWATRVLKAGKTPPPDLLWTQLKRAIAAKREIFLQDPEEKKGIRSLLNLGHTVGHILESALKIPHGLAVGYGLEFALEWSRQRKLVAKHSKLHEFSKFFAALPPRPRLSAPVFAEALGHDKKLSKAGRLRFIFIQDLGRPLIKEVSTDEILNEARRQSWIKENA